MTELLSIVFAVACIGGYALVALGKAKLGFAFGALGSAGWFLISPNPAFAVQSAAFLVFSVYGYAKSKP